jgi:cyanophycinase-like exopeptidase
VAASRQPAQETDIGRSARPDPLSAGTRAELCYCQPGRRLTCLRKPILLIAGHRGSRHFGTHPFLAEALQSTSKAAPLAVYVGAASGDDRTFGAALSRLIEAAGAGEVVWPRLTGRRPQAALARSSLSSADLVFVGGGDVAAGIDALREVDLIDRLRAAADRGAVFVGMSAGAIMLGERWIRWPSAAANDAEADTYECLGLAPCSLDTHGEDDDWRETRSFAAVRAREVGSKACAYAVPSGAALVVGTDGTLTARGAPVTVFAALPNEAAKVKATLEPAP